MRCQVVKYDGTSLNRGYYVFSIFDFLIFILISSVFTFLVFFFAAPNFMNADTIMMSVMSMQKPTIFVWGQNRLFNVVSILASPIELPYLNLLFQIFVYGISFMSLVYLTAWIISRIVFSEVRRIDFHFSLSILIFLITFIFSQHALNVFVIEGQPYALSYFLFLLGSLLIIFCNSYKIAYIIFSSILIFVSGGLNPSLIIFIFIAGAFLYIRFPGMRSKIAIILLVGFLSSVFWLFISKLYPGPDSYSHFGYRVIIDNFGEIAIRQIAGFFVPGLIIVSAFFIYSVFFVIFIRREGSVDLLYFLLLSCIFSIVWEVVFSGNAWVGSNGWHFRYFFPVFFIFISVFAAFFLSVLKYLPGIWMRAASLVLVFSSFLMIFSPIQSINTFSVFDRVEEFVEYARDHEIRYVSGDYWSVWPAVFLLMADRNAFGMEELRAAENGDALRSSLREDLETGQVPRAICVDADVERCLGQAFLTSGLVWVRGGESCGSSCTLIELSNSVPTIK